MNSEELICDAEGFFFQEMTDAYENDKIQYFFNDTCFDKLTVNGWFPGNECIFINTS